MGVVDNLPDRGAHLFDLGRLAVEPPQAGSCVGYDGAERLIHFMRDRRGHLSEHGHTRDMGERGLSDLQCFLRLLGRGHVHQRTDEFLLTRFIGLTMCSNVNVFDPCIGRP
jgi:hypothetical protein